MRSGENPTHGQVEIRQETPPGFAHSKLYAKEGLDRISEQERKLYEVMVPEHKASAINMDDFSDLYGDGVAKDKAYVFDMEKVFRERDDANQAGPLRRAELLEAILAERIELDEWLGPDAETIATSRFDDIRNGVDMIAEFVKDGGFRHLALSVDVTSSQWAAQNKIQKVMDNISKGELTHVKYFKSERADIRGELGSLPKVVIGMDLNTIKELSDLRLQVHNFRNVVRDPEQHKDKLHAALQALANHRSQFLILEQIKMQLEKFADLALRYEASKKLRGEFSSDLIFINNLIAEKEKSVKLSEEDLDKNRSDEVYHSIRAATRIPKK